MCEPLLLLIGPRVSHIFAGTKYTYNFREEKLLWLTDFRGFIHSWLAPGSDSMVEESCSFYGSQKTEGKSRDKSRLFHVTPSVMHSNQTSTPNSIDTQFKMDQSIDEYSAPMIQSLSTHMRF